MRLTGTYLKEMDASLDSHKPFNITCISTWLVVVFVSILLGSKEDSITESLEIIEKLKNEIQLLPVFEGNK